MTTPREQLASALKFARQDAGFDSQAAFARRLKVSRPVISKAENPAQPVPSDALLAAWSEATGVPLDQLANYSQRAKSSLPQWFGPYRQAEQEATHLRLWGPLVIPGLLQTENYVRALLSARPRPAEQLQALVDARIERQQVIGRAQVTAVIDYRVLAHPIGSPAVMTEQCRHLATLVESHLVSLHVVPERGNVGLTGAFAIATKDGMSTVSLTASSRDITSMAADVVDENMSLFDAILGSSLPPVESLEFVRTREEAWKAHQ